MTRILLTGFGAFPGAPVNPTQAIVHALATRHRQRLQRAGIDLRTAILPVVYAQVEAAIGVLLKEHNPDVVIHLGLAGRRRTISIETRARNRLSTIHPDATHAFAPHMTIVKDGAQAIPARWPARRMAAAASRGGFAAHTSIDAGDYLCNQALYISLAHHKGLCGFIHVPRLQRNLPIAHRLRPFRRDLRAKPPALPNLCDLENAVFAAISELSVEHRRVLHRIGA